MQSNKNQETRGEKQFETNNQHSTHNHISKLKQSNQFEHDLTKHNPSQINPKLKNGHPAPSADRNEASVKSIQKTQQPSENGVTPFQTFDLENFKQIEQRYDGMHHQVAPTVELTQAHMMTTNFKEAANIISGSTVTQEPNGQANGILPNGTQLGALGAQEAMDAGTGYFYKQDYMADLVHKCHTSDMNQVNRLLTNLGTQDKASNFLLEQRNLKRAQANEGRDVRDMVQKEVIDNLEFCRTKEQIAQAKYRTKHLIDDKNFDSVPNSQDAHEGLVNGHGNPDKPKVNAQKADQKQKSQMSSPLSSETQEDSGQNPANIESNGRNSDPVYDSEKIGKVIRQIRHYGQKYLAPKDGRDYASDFFASQSSSQFTFNVKSLQERILTRKEKNQINGSGKNGQKRSNTLESLCSPMPNGVVPLVTICKRLRKDKVFRDDQNARMKLREKKRDKKAIQKGMVNGGISGNGTINGHCDKSALINDHYIKDTVKEKDELSRKIQQIQTVMGLDKRMRTEEDQQNQHSETSKTHLMDLDMRPMNSRSFEIQNALLDFCGVNTQNIKPNYNDKTNISSNQTRVEKFFGKIRKLPNNSNLLQNYGDKLLDLNDDEQDEDGADEDAKKAGETKMVKVIGLEPEKLFEMIPKYRVTIDKLPKFSSHFDSVDSVVMGMQNKNSSLAGQSILNPISSQMSFQRIDGRQVISLQFNPFFLNEAADSDQKKKIYEQHMREILDSREKIKNAPKDAKNKQEVQNFKRAWQNIVKKDIPKAYRMYQKYKADQENNNKKLSQNCLKEVRKRAVKTQRLAKESVMRARRLTKDMVQFWRRRDREIADSKRKREKMDKELKKRQQEEEEALLQKKRLEYLMQQSEIYAHFMSTKLGVNEDHKKGKEDIEKDGIKKDKRFEIDKKAARKQIAGIINENRKRLDDFDDHDRDEIDEEDLQEHKFNEPKQLTISVEAPRMFKGDLKAYQLKGLQWLDNLYDQGINGILADEMGLGKTIQAISLMAHLAEKKGVWGPFLIVVPVTTLHNWQNELAKFCPDLKVLPYFGSSEERKKLAKFLDPKNLYNPAMRIHVLITSYNIVVGGNTVNKDQMRLQRVKWHYMILDEAQAIKNNQSRRWKTLLNFQTRNRLLLSGTPIQNSMAELWALLHFIMPKLFDNHEQFQEWFSKDIEQHSMDQGELNKHQLKRLHLILQPFMLRRLKKDVEQEIAPKIEETISCEMTHRQKVLYDRIKRKISMQDLFQQVKTKAKMENLMNLVMQFRKVCNHPDLFERRLGKIPFVFSKMNHGMVPNLGMATRPDVMKITASPITFEMPKLVFDECFLVSDNNTQLFTRQAKYRDTAHATVSVSTHFSLFNIFNESNLYEHIWREGQTKFTDNTFSILGLLASSNHWSISDLAYLAVAQSNTKAGDFMQGVALLHFYSKKQSFNQYMNVHNSDKDQIELSRFGFAHNDSTGLRQKYSPKVDAVICEFVNRNDWSIIYKDSMEENIDLDIQGNWALRQALVPKEPIEFLYYTFKLRGMVNIFYDKVICEPIEIHCGSTQFSRFNNSVRNNPMAKKALIGYDFKPAHDHYIGRIGRDRSAFLSEDLGRPRAPHVSKTFDCGPPIGYKLTDDGILSTNYERKGSSTFQLPDYSRMITDCSKMAVLAELLLRLHKEGHRCLIFCQMTKMMDILEDFLIWQKFSYFRMDGSTMLQDRRFMVEEYQTNPSIFAFILSTRAGGLGINLIAADTVIFYDNDWNPTMDSQATDRAHRIGQRKTVHVYRLVTKNTVEERILLRARQKESVQSTVYGANLKADTFSARDAVEMIYDDIEDPLANLGQKGTQVKGFIKGSSGLQSKKKGEGKRKKKKGDADTSGVYHSVQRISQHERYENEIDQLLNDVDPLIKEKLARKDDEVQEIQEDDDEGLDSGSDGELSQESDLGPQDAKRRLLKMLEKKGGAKQVFNFEEDDGQEMLQQNANGGQAEAGQGTQPQQSAKKAGRPRAQKPEYEDDEMDEEEGDF